MLQVWWDYILPFFSNPYFTPDVIGEPLTNGNVSYIKVFGISPSSRAADTTDAVRPRDEDKFVVISATCGVINYYIC
jgi:hypothetical protein